MCFSLLFNVLSVSPFESVFIPSSRTHLPECAFFDPSDSLVLGLNLAHERLEVHLFEFLELLLVVLGLEKIGLEHLVEEVFAAGDVFGGIVEEVCEIEFSAMLDALIEAPLHFLELGELFLMTSEVCLESLSEQVNLSGLAVVFGPLEEAFELFEGLHPVVVIFIGREIFFSNFKLGKN